MILTFYEYDATLITVMINFALIASRIKTQGLYPRIFRSSRAEDFARARERREIGERRSAFSKRYAVCIPPKRRRVTNGESRVRAIGNRLDETFENSRMT